MRDEFYMVLPSNSSMDVYPENTTTSFMTYLPQPVLLTGTWVVALTEIQIPLTLQHIGEDVRDKIISFFPTSMDDVKTLSISSLSSGVYNKIENIIDEINNVKGELGKHLKFVVNAGRYVKINKICDCEHEHFLVLSKKLMSILGFDAAATEPICVQNSYFATRPASLLNGLPNFLMIYTNILEPHVTGNVQSPLLRSVTLDLDKFTYGNFQVKNFSPPMYLPVLLSSFRNIEIDIRDQFGKPIPFDYGTLTVTLHFKRAL